MTRRSYSRGAPPPPPAPDPFAQVAAADSQIQAEQLGDFMETLTDYDQGSVKGILYQKPVNGQGPYKWIDELYPPFDLPTVFSDLRERFGGGDFELRVFAGGRIRKNVNIPLARERERAGPPAAAPAGGMSEMVTLMLQQAAEGRRDQAAAAARQMEMFMAMGQQQTALLAAVLPALAGGGGGKTSETVALITALQDRQAGGGGGMKETLEAMAAFKTLFMPDAPAEGGGGGDGAGFDPDDLIGSGARLVGPAVRALADYVNRQQRPEGAQLAGWQPPGGGQVQQLPPPEGEPPPAGGLVLGVPGEPPPSRFRILNLVRVDVLYCYGRGHTPDRSAEIVYDVIEAANVPEAELAELAAAFTLSPSWLDDLAAEGIDLRGRPGWAAEFFAALLAIHQGEADDFDGDERGEADPSINGASRAPGPGRPKDS